MQAAVAQSAAVARFPAKRAGQTGALARRCESLEIRAPDARKPPVRAWPPVAHCIQSGD
jgi:hypothetical protein